MEIAGKSSLRSGLSSRSGALALAAVIAVIAAVLVFAALNSARKDAAAGEPAVALVADQLIPKGSSGQQIASAHSFRSAEVRESALVAGAVTDVSQLKGKVATADIYPGQQLAAGDFAAAKSAIVGKLGASDRALSIPLDASHGMVGNVQAGDRVDVLAGFNVQPDGSGRARPVLKVLARDVVVLKVPKATDRGMSSSRKESVTLRVGDRTASQLAFASDNGKVWIVLRPGAGAKDSTPSLVTLESILFGVPSVAVARQLRGKR